jgi:GR25 family glycosyltransferase involved in LPS biosynthesis
MKPSKAYIIRIDTPESKEYAKVCAESCDKVGVKWEYFEGYKPTDERVLWGNFHATANLPIKKYARMALGAAGCTASHAHLWKQIADRKECAIILEHDAIMVQPCNVELPDDRIVALGYKYYDALKYNAEAAGEPKKVVDVDHNHGSHAYAISYKMAEVLVKEIEDEGIICAIDNRHFLPMRRNFTKTKMAITDPICALGWLRESTIWGKSASENNVKEMLYSFKSNFTGNIIEKL